METTETPKSATGVYITQFYGLMYLWDLCILPRA